jgi:hypothetical protein
MVAAVEWTLALQFVQLNHQVAGSESPKVGLDTAMSVVPLRSPGFVL